MIHSPISRNRKDISRRKLKTMGDHKAFLSRIKKSLYYGKLPDTERFSFPVSEIASELFSKIKSGKSLDRLDIEEAARLSRNACVSPCSLVLALLYLERLKTCNSDYLHRVAPSELFLVSMMIASKFLNDNGEEDEVFNDEWAASAGIDVKKVNRFEKDFLHAIGWEVFVTEEAFWQRLHELERDVALKEGRRRGWFSYSDFDHLLETMDLTTVAQTILSVSAVCLTSYTASVLTLIGSAFIVSQIPGSSISSSISSIANSRVPPAKHSVENTSTPLPSQQIDEAEVNSIVSSLSSCSTSTMPEVVNRTDHRSSLHTSPHSTDYWHWSEVSLPSDSNRSYFSTMLDKDGDALNLLHAFLELNSKGEGIISGQLVEWLSWVKAWLEISAVQQIQMNDYWPVEISVTC